MKTVIKHSRRGYRYILALLLLLCVWPFKMVHAQIFNKDTQTSANVNQQTLTNNETNNPLIIEAQEPGMQDTLLFHLGDGSYIVNAFDNLQDENYGKRDKVIFGESITKAMISFSQTNDDLIVTIADQGDQIVFSNYYKHSDYQTFNRFEFANGEVWADIRDQVLPDDPMILTGTSGNDTLIGGSGNDTINAGPGNDSIYGGGGDDSIDSGSGDDYVEAGAGNDIIRDTPDGNKDGGGNDTYMFHQGHGQDTLTDAYGIDTVIFADLKFEDARFMREGDHLIILGHGEDKLNIQHFFYPNNNYRIENFQFGDQKITVDDFWRDGLPLFGDGEDRTITGWAGADIVYGGSGNEIINTFQGNDTIYGSDGDDTIDSGSGNDYVEAGAGNDIIRDSTDGYADGGGDETYMFRQGHGQDILTNTYGNDTVIFADLKLEDARFMREGDHLIIYGHGEDKLTINHFFYKNNAYQIENFQFGDQKITVSDFWHDGLPLFGDSEDRTITGWAGADIVYGGSGNETINTFQGNDTIYGGDGDDTIDSGSGNDYVEAGAGNDIIRDSTDDYADGGGDETYMFRQGHGQDILTNTYGNDTVIFADLKLEDARFMREGDHLIIYGHGEDKLTINHFFYKNNAYQIENFQFGEQKVLLKDILPLINKSSTHGLSTTQGVSDDQYVVQPLLTDQNNRLLSKTTKALNNNTSDQLIIEAQELGMQDTLLFHLDDGSYVINAFDNLQDVNYGKRDKVIFGEGITKAMISFSQTNDDLIVTIADQGDQIVFSNYYKHSDYQTFNRFEFANGEVWADIRDQVLPDDPMLLTGTNGNDILIGGSGNDTINAGPGNDSIYGGGGDDSIDSGSGDDYVEAGAGNDYITDTKHNYIDGGGDETYMFRQGHGQDTLMDQYGSDTVIFSDLKLDDARFMREGDHLIILGGGDDKLTINHFFAHPNYYIENFQFGEQKLTRDDFWRYGLPLFGDGEDRTINGWDGADIIHGGSGNETIITVQGNDTIYGGDGDDTIDSGSGDDYVEAGAGNDYITDTKHNYIDGGGDDTYMFRRGHGQDTLMDQYGNDTVIFSDLQLDDARFMRKGDHLIILGDGDDKLTINHFFAHPNYYIEHFQFGEQKLTRDDFWRDGLPLFGDGEDRIINGWGGVDIIYGGSGNETINTFQGNDTIFGGDGDDSIDSGSGNDYVEAGAGNDFISDTRHNGIDGGGDETYMFRQGHGQDILMDQYGSDTVIFSDLKLDDALFMREGDHLIIYGHGEDKLTINHFFFHPNYYIEYFEFGEQKLTRNDILPLVKTKSIRGLSTMQLEGENFSEEMK